MRRLQIIAAVVVAIIVIAGAIAALAVLRGNDTGMTVAHEPSATPVVKSTPTRVSGGVATSVTTPTPTPTPTPTRPYTHYVTEPLSDWENLPLT